MLRFRLSLKNAPGAFSADLSGNGVVLIYGGVPVAIGASLLYAALTLRRGG